MAHEYGVGNRRIGGERREDYFPTHVAGELCRLDRCLVSLKEKMADNRQQFNDFKVLNAKEITALQVKSGIISGITSIIISAGVAALLTWIFKG